MTEEESEGGHDGTVPAGEVVEVAGAPDPHRGGPAAVQVQGADAAQAAQDLGHLQGSRSVGLRDAPVTDEQDDAAVCLVSDCGAVRVRLIPSP